MSTDPAHSARRRPGFGSAILLSLLLTVLAADASIQASLTPAPSAASSTVPAAPLAPPIAADAASVRFAAAADFSATPAADAVLSAMGRSNANVLLAVGDLSYGPTGQEQRWCDFVTSRVGSGTPFELLTGNHESMGQNGWIDRFASCLPNQLPGAVGVYGREYYVDVPQGAPLVRFVMISPGLPFPTGGSNYAAGSPAYRWTAAAIDSARAANIPWVVVGMHKPCLSLGRYGCDSGTDLFTLLLEKRVDLVLAGHDHSYQRTQQLATGPGCPVLTPGRFDASCIAGTGPDLTAGAGTVFAVVGTGGNTLYDVNPADAEAGYFAAAAGANSNPTWGFLDVSVTATTLQADFRRAGGGTFSDSFRLTR